MQHRSAAAALVAALAVALPGVARAETHEPGAERSWRFILVLPAARVDAHPFAVGGRLELGVQWHEHHSLVATGSFGSVLGSPPRTSPSRGLIFGGGLGYLYEGALVPGVLRFQLGALVGGWIRVENQVYDDMVVVDLAWACFAPTARLLLGGPLAHLQVGFSALIGNSVTPVLDLGVHFKL